MKLKMSVTTLVETSLLPRIRRPAISITKTAATANAYTFTGSSSVLRCAYTICIAKICVSATSVRLSRGCAAALTFASDWARACMRDGEQYPAGLVAKCRIRVIAHAPRVGEDLHAIDHLPPYACIKIARGGPTFLRACNGTGVICVPPTPYTRALSHHNVRHSPHTPASLNLLPFPSPFLPPLSLFPQAPHSAAALRKGNLRPAYP